MGDLAKGGTPRAALLLGALQSDAPRDVFIYEPGSGHMRAALVVGALRDAPTMPTPATRVGIAFEPGRADATLDLAAPVAKLGLIKRLPAMLADHDASARLRC
ncbi:MAG TPA: hypothetical protein VNV42_08490 [Solirubrobacteraceae bacterium]|nr:hypothetical protein [Solirubrobacteraceae bacterium]